MERKNHQWHDGGTGLLRASHAVSLGPEDPCAFRWSPLSKYSLRAHYQHRQVSRYTYISDRDQNKSSIVLPDFCFPWTDLSCDLTRVSSRSIIKPRGFSFSSRGNCEAHSAYNRRQLAFRVVLIMGGSASDLQDQPFRQNGVEDPM